MITAMGLVFIGVLYWQEGHVIAYDMMKGVAITFFKMMVLGAMAIFFSTFATPVVNFFLSFGIFIIGNMSVVTESLTKNNNPVTRVLANIVHFLLPNFGN